MNITKRTTIEYIIGLEEAPKDRGTIAKCTNYKDAVRIVHTMTALPALYETIRQQAERIAELEQLREAILNWEHHTTQASFDTQDGAVDPQFYDDAHDEIELARKAIEKAVSIAKDLARPAPDADHKKAELERIEGGEDGARSPRGA